MNKSSRIKELFFNNLLLLSFDKAAVEKEYRVVCDKNMFSLPNQKMFEVVTYFLFSKLDKKYILPWPLFDKDQHRQFQKLTVTYLSTIAQESNVKFPRMTASSLSTFSGDRFYEIYVAFSSHVIQQEIIANDNVELILQPKISSQNQEDVAETLKIETILSTEKFQSLQKNSLEHFEEMLKCSRVFSSLIKKLKSTLITNSAKLSEGVNHMCSLYCDSSIPEEKSNLEMAVKRAVIFQERVNSNWASIEKFLAKEKELWRYLCTVVEENNEKIILDGTDIKVAVPDILAKEHPGELNAVEISSIVSKENGKLDLLRYMKLFIIFLESYLKSYNKGEISNLHNHCNVEETGNLDKSLEEMKLLNEKVMNDVLSKAKESVENLQETFLPKEFSEDLEEFIKECPSWNFCSQTFHERVKDIRSKSILSSSDENPKSSLLYSGSSAETGCSADKLSFSTELCEASGYSDDYFGETTSATNLESFECVEKNLNAHKNPTCAKDQVFKGTLLETICKANSDTTTEHLNKIELSDDFEDKYLKDIHVNTALPSLQDLDLDFVVSKPFKMRESWLLEDSLEAQTLPDGLID